MSLVNVVIILLIAVVVIFVLLTVIGVTVVGSNSIIVLEKWWSAKGSVKDGEIIALNGEAGYQPDLVRAGVHLLPIFIYKIHKCPLITISQGQIGYVFARDGKSLDYSQTLGKVVEECNNFQNVKAFLTNGGQKGPQRGILREGTYAINLAQFIIITSDKVYSLASSKDELAKINQMAELISKRDGFHPVVIDRNTASGDVSKDLMGIVTVMDGPSLPKEDIIAPAVGEDIGNVETYHNNFQLPEKFLKAGGYKGRQHQVLVEGTYFINRLFATVEIKEKTVIDVGFVGVVNSFIGAIGEDVSGEDFKHGELVQKGCKGVWVDALHAGKYAFNTYAGTITKVPITNIILSWKSDEIGAHKLDSNLREITIITKDAFEPLLPLSIAIHIDYKKAPLVIQRFGTVQNLVDQALDILVSSYFKNIAQTKTLIELIQQRSDIQKQASSEMKERFSHYNLELEEVLLGTPTASAKDTRIETILSQLRDRQVAIEQIETYNQQQKSAEKQRELNEAKAKAEQQSALTQSQINIEIESNSGKAKYQKTLQDAESIKATASAEAAKTVMEAEANAKRVKLEAEANSAQINLVAEATANQEAKVGIAKALAAEEQVKAYGGPQFKIAQDVMSQFANAIKEGKLDITPKTLVNMGTSDGKSANIIESLITLMLSDKMFNTLPAGEGKSESESSEIVNKLKKDILESMRSEKAAATNENNK